ncbi:NUDIX domain-containing protein [Loigolactobacillus backii]|uniref:NAD(+) diphosphatase n=1 Tax=Loigolactobacillus backii TaxID=375175 RepID=A0A192H0P6_9LACO|nr:NUDIX domain-containing protein [Loigolactobacillus backii]ANK62369.1 NUDIX hydrolase [Loigolactobacillus backii]ANK70619.1 NUDIX hydrolase [Loigolactobacillus backii]MDA5387864.1 NUDIX domain-containing protein [Loigolactobacillus backii]MDA5390352.1 NUDIX domain-containing protein [Loigolactobacillus backii]PIO82842.1 NUDIX hydrolase [Loigolactobacillus backii]
MVYKYCPTCGTRLTKKMAGDDGLTPFCPNCERYWFPTFSDCVIVLVANELNEIVLAKMPYLSHQYASLISGYMQPGESAETSAKREVEEELGITLGNIEYAGTYWFGKSEALMHGFISRTTNQDLKLSRELASAKWVSVSEAPKYMFPDSPGNAAAAVYRKFVHEIASQQTNR